MALEALGSVLDVAVRSESTAREASPADAIAAAGRCGAERAR